MVFDSTNTNVAIDELHIKISIFFYFWYVAKLIPTLYKLSLYLKIVSSNYVCGDINLVPVPEGIFQYYLGLMFCFHRSFFFTPKLTEVIKFWSNQGNYFFGKSFFSLPQN